VNNVSIRYQFGDQSDVPEGFVRLTLWGSEPYDYTRSYVVEKEDMTYAIHKAKKRFIEDVNRLKEKAASKKKSK